MSRSLVRAALCTTALGLAALPYYYLVTAGRHEGGAALRAIERRYGIEIVTEAPPFPAATTYGVIDGAEAPPDQINRYSDSFVTEFSLYPIEFVALTGLRKVILCQNLTFRFQPQNGIADLENDTLYLDVNRSRCDPVYMKKVIHHEFFHLIDFRDDGTVVIDDRWALLNKTDFKYGRGGYQDDEAALLVYDIPGFLNAYSTSALAEDKAEVFANLMVEGWHVESMAKKDPIIAAKVERVKEIMASISPSIDEAFWRKARACR